MPNLSAVSRLPDTASTFQDGAGILANQLQSAISVLLVIGMMLWGLWIILSTVQTLQKTSLSVTTLASRSLTVLVLISLTIVLVYHVK